MMLAILSVCLLILISYIYLRWMKLKQYWKQRGVAFTPPHPLFGNMTFLQKENPVTWFRRLYSICQEPYMGIWVFWRPGLVVNSPDIAKNVLVKDQAYFRNRFATSSDADPIGNLNLFTLKDPKWSAIRKRLTVLFTSSKLRGMQTFVTQKSKELVQRFDMERQKLHPADLKTVISDYTTDVIEAMSFSVLSNATLTGTSDVRVITRQMMKLDFMRRLTWCSIMFIPELSNILRFKSFSSECIENMRKIVRQLITQRGGLENQVTEPRDLLDVLIKIKQENNAELEMTEDMMLAQCITFFLAGFESTGTVLIFAIYELAFCTEAQDKLFKELEEAKEKHGENVLNINILAQLKYLNCVIDETFRKHPPMGWIDRVAISDYKVDDHLTIQAGTPVYVNSVGMQYDPKFYPEPHKFNPDRFLAENTDNIKHFTLLPFGEGPRNCLGQRAGLSNVRHGLTAVLLNFEIRPLPNTPKPSDVKIDSRGLFLSPGELLFVEFIPRKKISFNNL